MPATRNVGKNIAELNKAHPSWSRKRKVAAGINMARAKGAKIPPPVKDKRGHRRRKKRSSWR